MKFKGYTVALSSLVALTLLLLASPLEPKTTVMITIQNSGVVTVEITGPVVTGLNTFQAPVTPILGTILAEVEGMPTPPIYVNKTIIVPADGSGTTKISYVANVTLIDGRAEFTFEGDEPAILRVEKGVILLTLPEVILETALVGELLEIRFQGPTTLAYVLEEAVKPAEREAVRPATEGVEEKPVVSPLAPIIPYVAGAVVASLLVSFYLWRRHKVSRMGKVIELDDVDKTILAKLMERGGTITQGELYRSLDLPKTTIWRHVRRLSLAGYLRIEPVGRTNQLRLLRRP